MPRPRFEFDAVEQSAMDQNNITLNDFRNRRKSGWSRLAAIYLPKYHDPEEAAVHIPETDYRTIFENNTTLDTVVMKVHLGWEYDIAIRTPKNVRVQPRKATVQ